MREVFLVNYEVKGIKNLEETVSLSFYKKTITMPIDTQGYNVKGIYGMNGSGKSGIITSVDIFRNLLVDENYLNNPTVQKNLDALINKKTGELYIGVDFLFHLGDYALLYHYEVVLKRNISGNFVINTERLSYKRASSRNKEWIRLITVCEGEITGIRTDKEDPMRDIVVRKTANLLSGATVAALFIKKVFASGEIEISKEDTTISFVGVLALFILGLNIYVYMDQSDYHMKFFLRDVMKRSEQEKDHDSHFISLLDNIFEMERNRLNVFSVGTDYVMKDSYKNYAETVGRLEKFIRIFKSDLIRIDIERKEDSEFYVCSLNMVYENYSVSTEFESTGIKKLIKLFAYIREMAQGGIVFIDEFDSNLHDVYLCALMEYLMEYGNGQLCFTTHNVGPMDILRKNRKSIDFLSTDHKIYPWTTNGNYSPSKLYKNGMIEGSPFNVDLTDFIGVFDGLVEEE